MATSREHYDLELARRAPKSSGLREAAGPLFWAISIVSTGAFIAIAAASAARLLQTATTHAVFGLVLPLLGYGALNLADRLDLPVSGVTLVGIGGMAAVTILFELIVAKLLTPESTNS